MEEKEVALQACQISVFLIAVSLERQAGYNERATAMFQALLDFIFVATTGSNSENFENKFEKYWDNELPRIGDTINRKFRY